MRHHVRIFRAPCRDWIGYCECGMFHGALDWAAVMERMQRHQQIMHEARS